MNMSINMLEDVINTKVSKILNSYKSYHIYFQSYSLQPTFS